MAEERTLGINNFELTLASMGSILPAAMGTLAVEQHVNATYGRISDQIYLKQYDLQSAQHLLSEDGNTAALTAAQPFLLQKIKQDKQELTTLQHQQDRAPQESVVAFAGEAVGFTLATIAVYVGVRHLGRQVMKRIHPRGPKPATA